jgi:selenium metabolism protein YedF
MEGQSEEQIVVERNIDACGLACPQPVLLTRKAMFEPGVDRVTVVVDSDIPAENIQRMACSQGWAAQVERQGGRILLTLEPLAGAAAEKADRLQAAAAASAGSPNVVVFVTSDVFGVGDEKLGRILMRAFVKTLKDLQPRPVKLVFANSGVRLTTKGSQLIDDLRILEQEGVSVISCGTCLDYYGLAQSLEVGVASNMYEIASSLVEADRIVHL